MIYISELNDSEKQKIMQALETDNFTDIVDQETKLSFSKGQRNFWLHSINLHAEYNTSMGLDIFLEEKKLVEYLNQLKSRHSTSLSQKTDSDIATAVQEMGWELVAQYNFTEDQYISKPESSTEMLHLLIKQKDHFALNHGEQNSYDVYEGSPDVMLQITMDNPDNFLEAPALKLALREIKEARGNS